MPPTTKDRRRAWEGRQHALRKEEDDLKKRMEKWLKRQRTKGTCGTDGKTATWLAKTPLPRCFAMLAVLFGDRVSSKDPTSLEAACDRKYVLGAIALARSLPLPWTLWLVVSTGVLQQYGEDLSLLANVFLVKVDEEDGDGSGRESSKRPRRSPCPDGGSKAGRRAAGPSMEWTLTRFLLLDDKRLAIGTCTDLDVTYNASVATSAPEGRLGLIRAALEQDPAAEMAVQSYDAGPGRSSGGVEGRRWGRRPEAGGPEQLFNAGTVTVFRPRGGEGIVGADEAEAAADGTWRTAMGRYFGSTEHDRKYGVDEDFLTSAASPLLSSTDQLVVAEGVWVLETKAAQKQTVIRPPEGCHKERTFYLAEYDMGHGGHDPKDDKRLDAVRAELKAEREEAEWQRKRAMLEAWAAPTDRSLARPWWLPAGLAKPHDRL
jgi:hypothetical protein